MASHLFLPGTDYDPVYQCLQFRVRAVAKGLVVTVFAVAERDSFLFVNRHLLRSKSAAFVATVTKRLLRRLAAAAPKIVSGFQFENSGFCIGNFWSFHVQSLPFPSPMVQPKRLLKNAATENLSGFWFWPSGYAGIIMKPTLRAAALLIAGFVARQSRGKPRFLLAPRQQSK